MARPPPASVTLRSARVRAQRGSRCFSGSISKSASRLRPAGLRISQIRPIAPYGVEQHRRVSVGDHRQGDYPCCHRRQRDECRRRCLGRRCTRTNKERISDRGSVEGSLRASRKILALVVHRGGQALRELLSGQRPKSAFHHRQNDRNSASNKPPRRGLT